MCVICAHNYSGCIIPESAEKNQWHYWGWEISLRDVVESKTEVTHILLSYPSANLKKNMQKK